METDCHGACGLFGVSYNNVTAVASCAGAEEHVRAARGWPDVPQYIFSKKKNGNLNLLYG